MINKRDIKITLDYIEIMKKEYNDINIVGSFNIVYDKLKSIINDYTDVEGQYEISINNTLKQVKKTFNYLKVNNKRNKTLIESISTLLDVLELE